MNSNPSIIGTSPKRVDAREKVTGSARYGQDLRMDGMLFARVKHAEYPHARIRSIKTARAKRLKGVAAVVTAADIPGNPAFGAIIIDNQPIAGDKVRYLGDAVAVVAAETEAIAERAVDLIEVKYEELPGVFDPREALKPDAPRIHEKGNLIVHHKTRKGDVGVGFGEADRIIERSYSTQRVEHAYIETEVVVAYLDPDGTLVIKGSHQNLFNIRSAVAGVLGLPLSKVRIIQASLGGSFGGKDDCMAVLGCRAGLLSLKTARPIMLSNSREDSLVESYKRHPYFLDYKVGVKDDGTITAMEINIVADGGAYASMTQFVTWRSVVHATGPYRVPHVKTDIYGAYTNNTYTGAFRGFGSPQITFAYESLMDEIAGELGMDPLQFRLKNVLRDNDVTATGQKLDHTVSVGEALEVTTRAAGWDEKRKKFPEENAGRIMKRGIGLACSYRGVALGAEGVDATGAIVRIHSDGSVDLTTGLSEMGQGLKTIFSQIVAAELGLPIEKIQYRETDTSTITDGGPTVASRSTIIGGSAVRKAAIAAREKLGAAAAEKLGAPPAKIIASDEKIMVKGDPVRAVSFREAATMALDAGMNLSSFAWHVSPPIWWNEEEGRGDAYFTYVYGCQIAEVEVDPETGRVNVLEVWAAHDVGKAINPETVRGQICGGVATAIGYGLLEEVEMVDGVTKTMNLDEYLIPTAMDVGKIHAIILENEDKYGPYGAKCVAEPTAELCAAAIANAVCHATGKRIRDLPLNLERIVLGHKLVKKKRRVR
ncbi:MAG: xanthine dehydrogenase family protein molybdopterin-binding subunit [Candidatus Euphemobacter frigidus]|nr:xanthine dehydrogenase family protein molybdopterin-binding subunit [Candidatus Euphemobacter frigidus]MDP8276390.1 xanthine dehydrogenase family protein molybdopterin-binding subunit [Candidatus Euphemobacter frigidus]